MDHQTSPSPPPKSFKPAISSSILGTPTFTSTLPFTITRSTSDSAFGTRASNSRKKRVEAASRRRRTRSAASSHSSSASVSELSMDDFSIDLAKLGEKPSGLVIGGAAREVEEIDSEDDGPEDFTLNMARWMRGGVVPKKERGELKIDDGDRDESENDLPAHQKRHNQDEDNVIDVHREINAPEQGELVGEEVEYEGGDESEFVPLNTSTPAQLRDRAAVPQVLQCVDEYEELRAPPLSRLNTEAKHDRAAEEVFERISALQAEVERLRFEGEERRHFYQALENEHAQLQEEHDDLKDQVHQMRSLAAERQQRQAIADESARTSEQSSRRDAGSKIDALRAKFEPMAHDLATAKSEAEARKDAADVKIAALEAQLRAVQEESQKQQRHAEILEVKNHDVVQEMKSELELRTRELWNERNIFAASEEKNALATKISVEEGQATLDAREANITALRIELDYAHEQLTETRRIVEVVEEENNRLSQENERQASDIAELKTTVDRKNDELRVAGSTTEELKAEHHHHQGQKEAGIAEKIDSDSEPKYLQEQHEKAIEDLNLKHASETKSLRANILKAAEGMRKREERLAKAHTEALVSLIQEIESFTAQQLTSTNTIHDLTTQFLSTKTDLSHAQQSLTRALDEAKHQQEDNEAVNAELEKRFAQVMEKREREWRRRIDLLLREREKMGRALMIGWGREEVGDLGRGGEKGERGQGYRYQFVGRQ